MKTRWIVLAVGTVVALLMWPSSLSAQCRYCQSWVIGPDVGYEHTCEDTGPYSQCKVWCFHGSPQQGSCSSHSGTVCWCPGSGGDGDCTDPNGNPQPCSVNDPVVAHSPEIAQPGVHWGVLTSHETDGIRRALLRIDLPKGIVQVGRCDTPVRTYDLTTPGGMPSPTNVEFAALQELIGQGSITIGRTAHEALAGALALELPPETST